MKRNFSLKKAWLLIVCFLLLGNAKGQYIITTIAGDGDLFYSGDGGLATAAGMSPADVKMDAFGNLYIGDSYNSRVRKIEPSGIISTYAGGGTLTLTDGSPATQIQLSTPEGIAVDADGNVYIADSYNNVVSKVTPGGVISIIAGNDSTMGFSGDGGPATAATLQAPTGIVIDAAGNIYIADDGNNRIRKINIAGIISTYAGSSSPDTFGGDGGQATDAELYNPDKIALDAAGNLYIGDTWNNRIRKVAPSGIITTLAGNGTAGYTGDGGPATAAELQQARGVATDADGNIYISDYGNNVLRKVSPEGIISTIAGTSVWGFSGNGSNAILAQIANPFGLVLDAEKNIYVADHGNNRVRKLMFSTLGLQKIETNPQEISLHLFPNPNYALFNITLSSFQNEVGKILITNIFGQKVKDEAISTNTEIEVQLNEPPGVYFLTAYNSMGTVTEKIILQ